MPTTRPAAVAGRFYPAEAAALRAELARCFEEDPARHDAPTAESWPKMLVVPHAGYVYSGAVAASAYATLAPARGHVQRVVLLGPSHQVPVRGLAAPTVQAFATPLGRVPLDQAALDTLDDLPQVERSDLAHALEHSLEVQLPFLQQVLGEGFQLVPLAVGDARPDEVAEVLDRLWGGPETLVLISSDLSHYEAYATAQRHDRATIGRVLALDGVLRPRDACGAHPLNGALRVAARRALQPRLLDLRNSGDTAGDKRRVVGYAAVAFHAPDDPAQAVDDALGAAVLAVARNAIAERLGQPAIHEPGHPALDEPGASFVTLHDRAGDLRGCIGRITPERALRDDLRANALAAAFGDGRFDPITASDWPGAHLEVSLLGPLQPVPAQTLTHAHALLRPQLDGLVVAWGGHQATFLPQVWEQLRTPQDFCDALWRKAGLRPGFWHPELTLQRFGVHSFESPVQARGSTP
jgi:AmmeMemoRadiSam system protein B/AmmeMemoRadiSam system protein A